MTFKVESDSTPTVSMSTTDPVNGIVNTATVGTFPWTSSFTKEIDGLDTISLTATSDANMTAGEYITITILYQETYVDGKSAPEKTIYGPATVVDQAANNGTNTISHTMTVPVMEE